MSPLRALLLLPLALAACSGGTDDDTAAPGGVSRSEARQLDEAAAQIDVNATFANETDAQP